MIEALPLLGIEEEYLVVDPLTRNTVPASADVLQAAEPLLGEDATKEITRFQVEVRTPPSADLDELGARLRATRARMVEAAGSRGLAIMACGIPVLGPVVPPPLSDGERYERAAQTYRALNDDMSICALHVHVDVPDPEHAVYVGNHLRPWLPTIIALAANSPYFAGRDTGYASWRVIGWSRWPVSGAPPYFSSYTEYTGAVAAIGATGAIMDEGTVFWDTRPSPRLPTIEIRVADVSPDIDDSMTVVGLIRGLVVTALTAVARGDIGPPVPSEVLRAAYWRAARDGLAGHGLDIERAELVPAADLARRLLDHVRPALAEIGDLPRVSEGLDRLIGRGSGASRQRRVFARRASLADVVDDLIRTTAVHGGPAPAVPAPELDGVA
ncbi:carboxylate-amine ligase [Thermostaphylospora chromogena]|uniref:Putative glutamate--cysteine ligase 2 n=1 Tax=Thermostaphylospora chromogena TaxID=35622 RepID=A0A1H1FKU2_9ACTN|nr:glutamate--cysteine ligase [Thermostaphylospora chromogena]SDR01339.1 carboxylate-amine ligase [Thermostaphylospora chromogena]